MRAAYRAGLAATLALTISFSVASSATLQQQIDALSARITTLEHGTPPAPPAPVSTESADATTVPGRPPRSGTPPVAVRDHRRR